MFKNLASLGSQPLADQRPFLDNSGAGPYKRRVIRTDTPALPFTPARPTAND